MAEIETKGKTEPELDLEAILDDQNKNGAIITLDETGKEVAAKTKEEVTKTNEQPTPEETIESLRKEIEASKVREAEKNERLTKLETEHQTEIKKATTAIDDAFKSKEVSIENSISAASNELKAIKSQLREAREKGDIDKEIELEEKLADTRYNYNSLNWEKNNLALQKKAREEAVKTAPRTDGTRQFSPREQKWISDHPRYNTDDDYQAFVWSLDAQAKKRGIIPDSDAYYDYINSRLEKMFAEPANTGEQTIVVTQPKTTASTAAPVGRGGSNGAQGNNVTQIRLTPAQLEAAEISGMSAVEYAQNLINQQKEKAGR